MSTFNSSSYGSVFNSGTIFSTVRGASSGTSRTNPAYGQATFSSPNYFLERGFLVFDTSTLGSGVTISSASIILSGASSSDLTNVRNYAIYGSTGGNTVSGSDYNKNGSTIFSNQISSSTLTTGGTFTWTLNASGISSINKTGFSKFSFIDVTYDAGNVAPTDSGFWGFNTPQLIVTFSNGNFLTFM